ncbi:putative zinc-type alcohol dehydrogenase-like protein [Rhodoblastus acidophilus]|uniref:NAD(P)-dependent alcohol dehydrogenase n=1 Tax=Rhodoblastus acidophilus TaxID=1074 RepID=UPI002223F189|nr:NAD(P)-dependent alcohol dehydrogenase [Rhodoblastus acidophilus]MCW2315781.1 putative zinc-type alcohol dehydrogenase-like protein [Rhodoblastus acidophilus]
MTEILGFAAQGRKQPLGPWRFARRALRADDVQIDIKYCGVCHSDLHQIDDDWGIAFYPLVPGHEIIGIVSAVGPKAVRFKVGDRVGVGCMVDSCQACDPCAKGLEQYCESLPVYTYAARDRHDGSPTYGGYSEEIVVTEKFVVRVPETLDLAGAAPLLCAGVTTWSPLRHWKVGPGSRVGVIGLGGLGHMALKLAKALGAEATLFTRSPGKEADARRLGAEQVVLSTDPAQMKAVANRFDLIIDTVPNDHDVNPYLPTLALDGTLVLVGFVGQGKDALSTVPLVFGRRSVAGSIIGGIRETQEMLDFCGKHGIHADIETIRMQDINDAYQRMTKSDVKYRFVIDMASLTA